MEWGPGARAVETEGQIRLDTQIKNRNINFIYVVMSSDIILSKTDSTFNKVSYMDRYRDLFHERNSLHQLCKDYLPGCEIATPRQR